MFQALAQQIRAASTVVLSTHRHCDGDGLGAELAVFHALRKLGKTVSVLNPDLPPKKYAFLKTQEIVKMGGGEPPPADLALIFDTNDRRLVEPLFSRLETSAKQICFIDHHPTLANGPKPTPGSVIDTSAASTGEMAFQLIKELGAELDAEIARALYTALVFDTQMFRYVKSDPRSHLMAAELLRFERDPEAVHQALFATYTVEKMNFLARSLASAEYFADKRVAFVHVRSSEARAQGLDPDESADIIDLVMNIRSVEIGALLRDDGSGDYKLSLRSKRAPILALAESFGGGGHPFAAGAYLRADADTIRAQLLDRMDGDRFARYGVKQKREIVCLCNSVPRDVIEKAIRDGADTLNKIFDTTTAGVGPCGGSCRRKLGPMLDHYLETGTFPEKLKSDNSGKCK